MASAAGMRRYQSWVQQQTAITGRTPSESERRRMLNKFLEAEESTQAQSQAIGLQTTAQETQKEQFEKSSAIQQEQFTRQMDYNINEANRRAAQDAADRSRQEGADKVTGIVQTAQLANELTKPGSFFNDSDTAISPTRMASLTGDFSTTGAAPTIGDYSTRQSRADFLGEESIEPGTWADLNLAGPGSLINAGLKTVGGAGFGLGLGGPAGAVVGGGYAASQSRVVPESVLQDQRFRQAMTQKALDRQLGFTTRPPAPETALSSPGGGTFTDHLDPEAAESLRQSYASTHPGEGGFSPVDASGRPLNKSYDIDFSGQSFDGAGETPDSFTGYSNVTGPGSDTFTGYDNDGYYGGGGYSDGDGGDK